MSVVKDKHGNTHTDKLKCWKEHFSIHLNTAFPHQPTSIDAHILDEIEQAVKKMKNRKAPGIDSITALFPQSGWEAHDRNAYNICNAIYI